MNSSRNSHRIAWSALGAAWWLAQAATPAEAGAIHYRFYNATGLQFDYSLQLANRLGNDVSHGSFVGARDILALRTVPRIGPGQHSELGVYSIAPALRFDGVAFNMLLADGSRYGLRNETNYHYCTLAQSWEGASLNFTLHWKPGSEQTELQLVEHTPDSEDCLFDVTPGYGPSMWVGPPPDAAPRPVSSIAAPGPAAAGDRSGRHTNDMTVVRGTGTSLDIS